MAQKKERRRAQKLRSERLRNGVDTTKMKKLPDGSKPPPPTKLVPIRIPWGMIDDVKAQASRFNMGWQPFMRLLVLQGLHHLHEHNSLDVPVTSDAEARALRQQQKAAHVAEWKAAHPDALAPEPKPKRPKKEPTVSTNGHHEVNGHGPVDTTNEEALEAAGVDTTPLSTEEMEDELAKEPSPHTSKAKLLRQMLEENDGPMPTIPAPSMEGIVEALTTSSVPPAPSSTRDVYSPPSNGLYVLMQASKSGEEIAIAREVQADIDKHSNGAHDEETITPELAAILFPDEEPTHGPVLVPDGPVPLSFSVVSTETTVSEPTVDTISNEATSEEIDALLMGDSGVDAEAEVSAEDMMEAVLNQFVPSEAEPVSPMARASDEDKPRVLKPPVESSEDDFMDLLNSL